MATITENPKVNEIRATVIVTPLPSGNPVQSPISTSSRMLFSDSLLEKSSGEQKQKTFTAVFSFCIQCLLLGVLVMVPLLFTEALPKGQLFTFLVAPPPPPPPPPPSGSRASQSHPPD
jgi:hypothetical protein